MKLPEITPYLDTFHAVSYQKYRLVGIISMVMFSSNVRQVTAKK